MGTNGVTVDAADFEPPCLGDAVILEEACRLADTGGYVDYTDIEYALCFGYALANAGRVLERQPTRRMLNCRCADARERLAVPGRE